MLRIPSFRKIGDLTVYQDDASWTRFHLLPTIPTNRRDENGRPVLLLTLLRRSDPAREEGGVDGGSFINFDIRFAVDEVAQDAAVVELQAWADEEYKRRKTDPQFSSLPEYAETIAPRVEIADPLLSCGTVSMFTTQPTQLVTGRFAEAPASLVVGSTALFSVDLTEEGASFMKQRFLTDNGSGRIDLTPGQVLYNLKMWARVPPVLITVTGDSDRIHTTLQKLSESTKDNVRTVGEIENYPQTGRTSSMLKQPGMVTVETDKGDITVPDEVLLELQAHALELFDSVIREKFLVKADASDKPLKFTASDPKLSSSCSVARPMNLDLEISGASLNWDLVRGVKATLTCVDPADATDRTKKTFELTRLNPVRKWEQRFNREANDSMQAKLTYFLADDKVVEGEPGSIDLTDALLIVPPPQVDVLNVGLVPSGDWSEVSQVVVLMKYDAGEGQVYDKTFRFTSHDQFAEWAVLLRDPTRRTFQYQTVITYKDGREEQSQWVSRFGDQAVLIQVKGVPKLRVNVLSDLVAFDRTPLVEVTLAYGEERKTLSFISPGAAVWEVPLDADGRREYTYEITWHPDDADPISSGLQRTGDSQLFIPRSPVAVESIPLIVRGFADWAVTPYIDVAVEWGDSANQQMLVTLSREAAQQRMEINEVPQPKFRYAITYNLRDGSGVAGAKGETADPVIFVPALRR